MKNESKLKQESKQRKELFDNVDGLVRQKGGWLQVISLMTNAYDDALAKLGKGVDCPFPQRHGKGQGKGDFRFTDNAHYQGRAICTCMQDRGMGPVELLTEVGVGHGWTSTMIEIQKALDPAGCGTFVDHRKKVQIGNPKPELDEKELAKRKKTLTLMARDLVDLNAWSAHPARKYFAKRGIPYNFRMHDVKFHPGLKYWAADDGGKAVCLGVFPAIVSAMRGEDGKIVSFHRIFITSDGDKAPVPKPKKICSPLSDLKGVSINVVEGTSSRVLNVTEGVEKGWAIHLATGGDVKCGYSCSSLPGMNVDHEKYDKVIIWSDRDPDREVTPGSNKRKMGDGQYFALKLAHRLQQEGVDVDFMIYGEEPVGVKGPDWEDIIVEKGVLSLKGAERRLKFLKELALNGGVYKQLKTA